MSEYEITSPTNDRIKRLVRLGERRHRDREGMFVVEGRRLFTRAIQSGLRPIEVYTDGSALDIAGADAILVEPSVLDKASYRQSSQGLIGVFAQVHTSLADVRLSPVPLVVVIEAVEKPGNLGAMMRTAAAVGADAVITIGAGTDLYNPNVLRASTGAIFSVPCVPSDLSGVRSWVEQNSIALVASSPQAGQLMWEADLKRSCALMIGAEDSGLSPEAVEAASETVRIPMETTTVDSLNASVSLAILAFEALRQRHTT